MSRTRLALSALILPIAAACSDRVAPTAPTGALSLSGSSGSSGGMRKDIAVRDDCEPESFNAVLGAGACVIRGSTTFEELIAQLQEKRSAGAWKNDPDQFSARVGTTLAVRNIGGEVHTFTRVAAYGGGVVPDLNHLAGTPVVAPECANLDPSTILPSGGRLELHTGAGHQIAAGTHKFQCCIHPWMRTTATLKQD